MKRYKQLLQVLTIVLTSLSSPVFGGNYGIRFEKGTWSEVIRKAADQHKLVFVDFYTEWCGPCLNMAENIFTLPDVGLFYNEHFICVQIDAEHGEGVALANKCEVHVYPTYCFIDPVSQKVVHRSSSTQSAETFLDTGRSALDPERRSDYLTAEYARGNRQKDFLLHYIAYMKSIYKREAVTQAFDQLTAAGHTLHDPDVWRTFVTSVNGITPYLKEVSAHYADYCRRYSQQEVDAKLFAETKYGKISDIESLCNFKGKQVNLDMIRAERAVNESQFDAAESIIDRYLADSTADKTEVMERLKFMMNRASYTLKDALPAWKLKCLAYARYLAYNWPDRKDGSVHQLYASMIEQLSADKSLQTAVSDLITSQPDFGNKTYTMRSPKLKMKPHRQNKPTK